MSPAAAAAPAGVGTGGGAGAELNERRRRAAASGAGRSPLGPWARGRAGGAALGLALLGLVLYLVPTAAALAWLGVGAAAAWWGLSPRGSRGGMPPAPPRVRRPPAQPAKAAVNGAPMQSQRPQPLMGGYLGQPNPPDPPRRERLGPQLLSPARRLQPRDHMITPNRFSLVPRRRYPIQQAQCSALGTLPKVCWEGYQRKSVLSARNSRMVSSPVTVRIARPDLPRSPLEQVVNSPVPSSSNNVPDPCAKETVMNALKESRKRAVEEEDDQIFCDAQENKRRRHDSSGSGHSAFEPLVANGAPASLVPKPGSLKRSLTSQCVEDNLNKRSRTSSTSSLTNTPQGGIPSSSRNAITSSYSSTRGCTKLWKRSGRSSSTLSSPASSRSQTPERPVKKAREEEFHQSSCSTSMASDKESQAEKGTDTLTWKKQSSWSTSPTSGSVGKRRRKVQLLASRRGDQLTLPPPPQLGYSITAEDLDLEKKAALHWFNKVLEEKTDSPPASVAETSPAPQALSFTLPSPETPSSSAAPPASSANNPLLDSLKKMQNSPSPAALPDPAGGASAGALPLPKPVIPTAAPGPSEPGPPAATSAAFKPLPAFSLMTSSAPLTITTPSQASPALGSDSSTKPTPTTSANPPATSSPKPSILFGMLSSPPLTSAAPTPAPTPALPLAPAPAPAPAPAAASAPAPITPIFKPIFGVPPKMESGASLPAAPMSSGSVPSTTPSTSVTTTTFKPIFGSMGPPTSLPLGSTSPFLKQSSSAAPSTTVTTAVLAPLFSGLSGVQATATSSGTTDSGSKPTFGFGMSGLASTMAGAPPPTTAAASTASSASTTTTPALGQPFLFGTAPTSGTSFTPSTGSMFQFNKPAVVATTASTTTTAAAATTTTFGTAQTASSSTTGFGFGGTVTTAAVPTTSQVTLTFGPSTTTAAFSNPFASSVKTMPPPSYPGAAPQPAFGTADGQQQVASKAGPKPGFINTFSFVGSAAPSPALPQPTFGGAAQPAFGGAKPPASFGAPASTQPAFGSTNAVFSFGTTTTSSFGATTQTTSSGSSSGTSSSLFSSMTMTPFTFGSSTPAASSGGFGASSAVPGTSSSTAAFSFGASQSGATSAPSPFGGALNQNPLATPSQSTPFAFSVANTTENKPVFGGTSTPTFGQNASAPGAGTVGSGLSFGTPSTPAQGFVGAGPSFGPSTPSFSIGAGSKTSGARQRLQARRQHTRKK